jgi:NADH-quinone oxidoreductase subunit M
VAEMTIFIGSFQHPDLFHRIVTITAASSIVVTAVYILRVVGILLLGPIKNHHYDHLKDATWYERLSTITLVAAIAAIGIAPLWLSDMIMQSLDPILDKLAMAYKF